MMEKRDFYYLGTYGKGLFKVELEFSDLPIYKSWKGPFLYGYKINSIVELTRNKVMACCWDKGKYYKVDFMRQT